MIKMNQEQNNLNSNSFNTQGNNGIPNNQPLNNQSFNQGMSVNQQPINPQPQPINTFDSGDISNQNFNSKPPKKMNLGLIIGIVAVVAVAIGAFILLGNSNNKFNKTDNNNQNNTQNNNSKNTPKYEGPKLTLFDDDDFTEINGKIKDVDINFNYIITIDNTLYDIGPNVEKKLELSKPIDFILDNHVAEQTADLLIKNKDGSVSHVSPYLSKINYTINLENIIYADEYNIITLEDGDLYNYTVENNKTTNKSKVMLYKERDDKKESYDSNIKVNLEYLSGDSSIFIKIDNEIRQFENFLWSINGWSSREDSTLSPSAGEREYLTNKKPVKMLYYDSVTYNEIYASEEKNTSIYYYDESSFKTIGDELQCVKENGSEALCYESVKKELALPENYTVNNIKEVRPTSHRVEDSFNILIVMDDMKAFYYDDEWRELEELSNLYKNNHVVKLITNQPYSSDITVLCDDGYLYEHSTY